MELSIVSPEVVSRRRDAARQALAICDAADTLAREAMECVGEREEQLFELIERRDEILQNLSEHIVSLKLERHSDDSPMFASGERAADEGDRLVEVVWSALDKSQRATAALAARVAARVSELRKELAEVQRAGAAHTAYAPTRASLQLDSLR